jgi:hypothetical protein
MEDDQKSSDGVVIAVAILLVIGLFAGGALLVRGRMVRARSQAMAQRFAVQRAITAAQGPLRPPRPSRSAPVTYTTATVAGPDFLPTDFLATDSNGDWVFLRPAQDGSALAAVFAIDCGPPRVEGNELVFSIPMSGVTRIPIDDRAVEVVLPRQMRLIPEYSRDGLAATIRGLPSGTASIAVTAARLLGDNEDDLEEEGFGPR